MRAFRTAFITLLAVLLTASPGWAQVSTSGITGLVEDPTSAVVAGAKVTAENEATGVVYEAATTTAGTYSLQALPPGIYTITVKMEGFNTFTSRHNVLTVGAPLVVDVKLQVGAVTQVVEVEATYQRLDTTSAMISDIVNRREIVELPLNGRNPLALINLQPGLIQRTNGSVGGTGTHVFGSRNGATNITVDGIDANESSNPNPQNNLYRLNPDNVQEYRVITHNPTPEFGRNSGAQVAIATRSGTNEYHGDLYWYHRNTALNANEWYNNVQGIEKPALLMHQFGAEGGGPILKNKTFFFVSWQGNRIFQTQPIAVAFAGTPNVYSPTLRSGLFRYFVPDPANPLVIDGVTITRNSPRLVDPRTGALRSGVRLCATPTSVGCVRSYNIFSTDPLRIGADPAIAAMVGTFPFPNAYDAGGDGLNFGGFAWNPPSGFRGPHYLIRLDHKFNDNNNIFGRMLWSKWDTKDGDFLNSRPSVFPNFPPLGEAFRTSQSLALSYRHVFSPNSVNELTVGFSRFHFLFPLVEANSRGNVVPPPYGQECFGTDSFVTIDTPFCNTPHTERAVSNIQFIDNLGFTRGAHVLRTGFNIRLYRHNDSRGAPGGFNLPATIVFDRSLRDPGFPAASGINSSDNINLLNAIVELTGIPARVQQAYVADFTHDRYIPDIFSLGTRSKQFNFYFQDEWKLRRNLTMTYGLRWELNLPPADEADRTYVPNLALDGSQGAVTYVHTNRWYRRKNATAFAPRLSLAWSPWGNTVIRAGYGIAFDTVNTFQVTAIGGKIPGGALTCRVNVQDSAAASAPCTDIPNDVRLSQLLNLFQPFTLGLPTVRPSSQLSPPPRPLGVAPDVGAFQPDLKLSTVHEWSLTIQRELPWSFVGQIGYIGKRGMRLLRGYDLNQLRIDQPGFLQDFLRAQNNMTICRANATACLAAQAAAGISASNRTTDNIANFGLPGQAPITLLSQLLGATAASSSAFRGSNAIDVGRNGIGDLARRIDQTDITLRGFPANYFRPNPQFSEIYYLDSGGSSSYHGMIVQLRRRFEKGLEFGFSYTWSKSIDDMSADPVGSTSGGGLSSTTSRAPSDNRNFRLDRAPSDFDNTHVLLAHYVYELPFGRGRKWGSSFSGVANHIFGGWSITGIFTYQSGEPYTINSGVRTANGFKQSRAELVGPMPPEGLQSAGGGPVVFTVSDIGATVPNCRDIVGTQSRFCIPAAGEYGSGRNAFRGPSFKNFDFGFIKNFAITERWKLQFRGEFFNLFNHPNFENPRNATVGSPTLTSSVFGQTCCTTASVGSSTTIIATGEPQRVIQFALKLSF